MVPAKNAAGLCARAHRTSPQLLPFRRWASSRNQDPTMPRTVSQWIWARPRHTSSTYAYSQKVAAATVSAMKQPCLPHQASREPGFGACRPTQKSRQPNAAARTMSNTASGSFFLLPRMLSVRSTAILNFRGRRPASDESFHAHGLAETASTLVFSKYVSSVSVTPSMR